MPTQIDKPRFYSTSSIKSFVLTVLLVVIVCVRVGTSYGILFASLLLVFTYYLAVFVANRRASFGSFERGNVPSIGNPKLLSGNLRETFFQAKNTFVIHDYHEKLGPTFGLFFGPDAWVQTTDLELLKRIFVTEGMIHVDKTQLNVPLVSEISKSVLQARGDQWRRTRRVIAPSFLNKQMQTDNVFNDIDAVGRQFIEFVEDSRRATRAGDTSDEKQPARFDVYHMLGNYSLEMMLRIAFGYTYKTKWTQSERTELIKLIKDSEKLFVGFFVRFSMMLPPLRHFFALFVQFTELGTYLKRIHSILDKSMKDRATKKVQPKDRKMIDSLIESSRVGKMDNETLKANLFIMMMSGHESTAFLMTFLLFTLARRQDEQDKLRRELQKHGEQAEYLDWCLKEALRLHPPGPNGHGRILEFDIEHKGMRLFKGTTVNPSIWSIHHAKEYWGDDVEEFRPERWGEPLDEEENPAIRLRQFAFGHGPRYCIGEKLAMAEMGDLITKLIVEYRVSASANTPRQLDCSSPNFYHWIIHHPVELEFAPL